MMKKFPIENIYKQEVERIKSARNSSKIIHNTGDIDASGDELEIPIRKFLKKRLPQKFYIGHGHIVDKNLSVSPQFDIIIADSTTTQILYDSENGTEYFPYESVYAIGEIKSTYYKSKKYLENFVNAINQVMNGMARESVPLSYVGNGVSLGDNLSINRKGERQNDLFHFVIIGDSNDMDKGSLKSEFTNVNKELIPNIICCLDGKIIVRSKLEFIKNGINLGPIAIKSYEKKDPKSGLVSFKFNKEDCDAHALILLMLSLYEHLTSTQLYPPPFQSYIQDVLSIASYDEGDIILPPERQ